MYFILTDINYEYIHFACKTRLPARHGIDIQKFSLICFGNIFLKAIIVKGVNVVISNSLQVSIIISWIIQAKN